MSLRSSVEEKTLMLLHSMYVDPTHGLLKIGRQLGLHLFAPRRKINILLIGNHSSGKSSFINWYVDDKIQKTGVAIETQGFTFVTGGKKRETLTGKATIHLYPYLKPLENIRGVLPYLTTELSPSNSRRFNLVTFIDTPGLADGELHYPYDIEKAIAWMGDISDLIFVFFDPIGQALCKRTLNLVERLNNHYSARMRFFLSKADEAGDETDRQKVMMQIVQELCKRPGLNQSGFAMMAIYLPNQPNLKKKERMCVNQIDDTCQEIEKTIALTIQNTFNSMERDINQLEELAENKMKKYQENMGVNIKNTLKLLLFTFLCLQFPLSVIMYQQEIGMSKTYDGKCQTTISNNDTKISQMFFSYMCFLYRLLTLFCSQDNLLFVCFLFSIILLIFLTKYFITFKQYWALSEMKKVKEIRSCLVKHRQNREALFSQYLNQMLNENDKQ